MKNSWEGDQAILRIQRLQKNKLKDTSTKQVTNQKGSKKCSKIKRELPKVRAQSGTLHFNMVCTTWNPHSLLENRTQTKDEVANKSTSLLRCTQKIKRKTKLVPFRNHQSNQKL